jgi:phosphatidylinositol dimannoside acyltransferase
LALLERGGVLALVADRDVTGEGIDARFFGEPTRVPGGPALLALRSGATLLPCAVYQRPGGVSEGAIRPPLDTQRQGRLRADVERVTESLVHEFESLIAAAPEQWHVFQPNWPSEAANESPS